jgi:serine O-acetyltransferase
VRVAPVRPGERAEAAAEPGAWASLRADLGRYFRYARAETAWERLRVAVHTEAVAALAVYRLGRWLREEAPAPARAALKLPHSIAHEAVRLALGICLSPEARIGPGLYIGHSGGIWVAPGTVIGSHCNLSQGVTLGVGGTVRRGAPSLGDRVWVGPKATVSGPVKVGSGAVVGANSLVVSNVPEKGVAVGVPARVVAYSGSGALMG